MTEHGDFFRLPEKSVTAAAFWDVYYSGRLMTCQRRPQGYQGDYDVYTRGQMLPKEQPFTVSRELLLQYDYAADIRFESGVHPSLSRCFAAVLKMPAMALPTVPNQHQLALARRLCRFEPEEELDYPELRSALIGQFESTSIETERVLELLDQTRPGPTEHELYEQTGRTAALHVERVLLIKALALSRTDPRITEALAGVVESGFEDTEVVAAAIWAVGRHNDKTALPRVLMWLGQERLSFHGQSIGQALQFLCSGPELIPMAYEDEYSYWKQKFQEVPRRPADWEAWDASSVFWQKRCRCALFGSPAVSALLLDDEVLPVKRAAAANGG